MTDTEYTEEEFQKLKALANAIDSLEGISIRYDIQKRNIIPLREWLMEVLGDRDELQQITILLHRKNNVIEEKKVLVVRESNTLILAGSQYLLNTEPDRSGKYHILEE